MKKKNGNKKDAFCTKFDRLSDYFGYTLTTWYSGERYRPIMVLLFSKPSRRKLQAVSNLQLCQFFPRINPLPNNKILDKSNLKDFVGNKINVLWEG